MKEKKKHFSAVIAVSLALSILAVSTSAAVSAGSDALAKKPETQSVHNNVDITAITGEVVEPPMLTSAASSVAKEKQWYEYVYYSEEPVAYYYVSDTARVAFYDPYDYSSSLIMEVDDSITDWSSNNSMQVSYTTGNSMTNTDGSSCNTVTTTQRGYTDTTTTSVDASVVTTKVDNQTNSYNTSKTKTTIDDNTVSWSIGAGLGGNTPGVLGSITSMALGFLGLNVEGSLSGKWGTTTQTNEIVSTDPNDPDNIDGKNIRTGYTKSNNTTTVTTGPQTTTITNRIADRTSQATGYTSNSSVSLSTDNSTTITKTYDAGYFNASGAPLQWKIVKYTVKMPMYYQVEYLIDGEWIFGDSNYCTINTIQGTCRAWLQNNVAYYEHWGTGEPVTWDEFWSQFFTEEKLIDAYKNKLYPDN